MNTPGVRPSQDYRLLEEETKFSGRVAAVRVERLVLPNGVEVSHEILKLPRAVAVVPLLLDAGGRVEVVLVEQFRSALRGYIHEIPAGILEPGEDPAVCAARELEEETGYVADQVEHLATLLPIPGTSSHLMDFFVAEGLREGRQALEEAECLTVKRFALDDLLASMVGPHDRASGGSSGGGLERLVVDSKTHLGLLHVAWRRYLHRTGSSDDREGRGGNP
jgi:ADP-ribose pyrophosphatase